MTSDANPSACGREEPPRPTASSCSPHLPGRRPSPHALSCHPTMPRHRTEAPFDTSHSELGDGQLDAADPGVPVAGPVAVALGGPLQAALAELRADLRADVGLHELACHP